MQLCLCITFPAVTIRVLLKSSVQCNSWLPGCKTYLSWLVFERGRVIPQGNIITLRAHHTSFTLWVYFGCGSSSAKGGCYIGGWYWEGGGWALIGVGNGPHLLLEVVTASLLLMSVLQHLLISPLISSSLTPWGTAIACTFSAPEQRIVESQGRLLVLADLQYSNTTL